MAFDELKQIPDELERIRRTYEVFDEDTRLNGSKAARVEFLTSVRVIEQYLTPGARLLDLGAGAGEYSLHFARKGFDVTAVELSPKNVAAFRRKLRPEDRVTLLEGNAADLSAFAEESFDAVLLFGPLYHMGSEAEQLACIREAKRVCKKGGKLFFAFISNDFVILTEFGYSSDYFLHGDYDKATFRLDDFPFVFHTVDACRALLAKGGIRVLREVAADGASELMAEKLNALDEEAFAQYLRYHWYICEKKELLGMTNHLLFVGEKEDGDGAVR